MKKLALTFVYVVGIIVAFASAGIANAASLPPGTNSHSSFTWINEQEVDFSYCSSVTDCTTYHFYDQKTSNDTHVFVTSDDDALSCKVDTSGAHSAQWGHNGHALLDFEDYPSNTAQYVVFKPGTPGNQNCGHQSPIPSVKVQSSSNKDVTYVWQDDSTILSIDDGHTFVKNTDGDYYDTKGTCRSSIAATPGSTIGNTAGKLTRRATTLPGGSAKYTKKSGCYVEDTPESIKISRSDLSAKKGTPTTGNPTDGGSTSDDAADDPCSDVAESYSWVACPGYNKLVGSDAGGTTDSVLGNAYKKFIQPLFRVDPLDSNKGLQKVVAVFITLADVFFVIVFLIMILGTSFNLNAYTVKRTLPRLVIAAIAIQFSYFLCGIIVDIGNVFGDGILGLVASALAQGGVKVDGDLVNTLVGLGAVGGLAGIIAASIILGPAVLLIGFSLLLAVLTFFFTLLVRKIMIAVLIILAPLAIAASVLPNTEQYYKKWLQLFIKIIMVYPVASLIVAGGAVAQASVYATLGGALGTLAGAVVSIVAFFMMPMAFKWGGNAMQIAGRVGAKYSGGERASRAASNAGRAPVKGRIAAVSKNRQAIALANRNSNLNNPVTGGGFRAGLAGIRARQQAGVPTGLAIGGDRRNLAQQQRQQRLDSAKSEQIKNLHSSLEGAGVGTLGADGKIEAGQENTVLGRAMAPGATEEMQQAAIMNLAKNGRTKELQALQKHMDESGAGAAYSEGIRRSDTSKIREKAPHLVGGGGAASYGSMNAEKLSKLDAVGAQAYMNHLQEQKTIAASTTASSADKAAAQAQVDNFTANIDRISADKKLANGANNEGAKVLLAGKTSEGILVHDATTKAHVDGKINSLGQFI